MKNIAKFVICALLLCSSVDVHAKSSKGKKVRKERPMNAGSWEPFVCETGIDNESVTVQFPRKPLQEYDDGRMVFNATAEFVNYIMLVIDLEEFEDMFYGEDLLAKREEYADKIEFGVDGLRKLLQYELDHEDEDSQLIRYNVYVNGGYPTFDSVELDIEENKTGKRRIVITEHAAYVLISRHKVGLADRHTQFVDSLRISPCLEEQKVEQSEAS